MNHQTLNSAARVYEIGRQMGARLPHHPLSRPAQHMGTAPFSTSRFLRSLDEGTRYVRSSHAHIEPMPDPIAERGHRLVPWACLIGLAFVAALVLWERLS
jgi:hypothetical protein